MSKNKIMKESLLVGALTSSFGVFVSKLLGLLYYSPLSALAGEENMYLYSITYTYYDLLLKISSAGIPFAIAALVAKYVAKEDYKTAMVVKKLGTSLVMALSFVCAIVFIFISTPLAKYSMGSLASANDIQTLKNLFLILIVAVILVPYLSTVRGYYQGLKRLDLYASSQVLEQFARVASILLIGFITVKIIKLENIWAIYGAIAAASVAAIVAVVFFKFTTKEDDKRISLLIKGQTTKAKAKKAIFKEVFSLGIPYLLISFLGTAGPLVNTTFFLSFATEKCAMPISEAKLELGILQANCSKLLAIPQVLTSGFCAGLVPYLTESLEIKDYKKLANQVSQIIDTVLFILVPVLLIFFFFAKDIYLIMYGAKNVELGSSLFRVSLATGFTETVLPILSSIMITLRLKKESVLTLLGCFVIKFATFFLCVKLFWTAGLTVSTCIASISSMVVYAVILNKKFGINLATSIKRMLIIFVTSLEMAVPAFVIRILIPVGYSSRVISFALMGIFGIMMLVIYYFVSIKLNLVQTIFGIKDPSISNLIKKFRM